MSTVSPESTHPRHSVVVRVSDRLEAARPQPGTGWTAFRRRRACRAQGGHWWHPLNGMGVDWFCCQCGTLRQGQPKDGT